MCMFLCVDMWVGVSGVCGIDRDPSAPYYLEMHMRGRGGGLTLH